MDEHPHPNTVYGKVAAMKIANVLYTKRYCCICLDTCDGLVPLDTCEAIDGGENNLMILTLKEMIEAVFDGNVLNVFRESSDHMCPSCRNALREALTFIEKTKTTALIFAKYLETLNRLTMNLLPLTDTEDISSVVFNLNLDVNKDVNKQQSEKFKRKNENDCNEVSKKAKTTEVTLCEELNNTVVCKETKTVDNTIENIRHNTSDNSKESRTPNENCKPLSPHKETKRRVERKQTCPVCDKRPCKHEIYLVAFEKRKSVECPDCKELLYTLIEIIDHVNRGHFKSKPTIRDVCCKIFQGDLFKKDNVTNGSHEPQQTVTKDQLPLELVEEPLIGANIEIKGTCENIELDAAGGDKVLENNVLPSNFKEKEEIQQESIKKPRLQELVKCGQYPVVLSNEDISLNTEIYVHVETKNTDTEKLNEIQVAKNEGQLNCEEYKRKTVIECSRRKNIVNLNTGLTIHTSKDTKNKLLQNNDSTLVLSTLHENKIIDQCPKTTVFKSCLMKRDKNGSHKPKKSVKFAQFPIIFTEKVSINEHNTTDTNLREEAKNIIENDVSMDVKLIEENANLLLECKENKQNTIISKPKSIETFNTKLVVTPRVDIPPTVKKSIQREVRIVLVDVIKDEMMRLKPQCPVKSDVQKKVLQGDLFNKNIVVSLPQNVENFIKRDKIVSQPKESVTHSLPSDKIVSQPKESVTRSLPSKTSEAHKSETLSLPRHKIVSEAHKSETLSLPSDKIVSEAQKTVTISLPCNKTVSEPQESLTHSQPSDKVVSPPQESITHFPQNDNIVSQSQESVKQLVHDKTIVFQPQEIKYSEKDVVASQQEKSIKHLLQADKHSSQPQKPIECTRYLKVCLNRVQIITDNTINKGTNVGLKVGKETEVTNTNKEQMKMCEMPKKGFVESSKDKSLPDSQNKLVLRHSHADRKAIPYSVNGNLLKKGNSDKTQELVKYPVSRKEALRLNILKEQELDVSDESTDSDEMDPVVDAIEEKKIIEKNQKQSLTCEKQRRNRTFECPECKKMLYSLKDLIAHVNKKKCNKPVVIDVNDKEFHGYSFKNNNHKVLHTVAVKTHNASKDVRRRPCSRLKTNIHKENRKYECSQCDTHPCKHEKYMSAYEKLRGNRIIKCPECKDMIYSLSDLIAHVSKKHSESKTIIRNICNKEYQSNFIKDKNCLTPQKTAHCVTEKIFHNRAAQMILNVNKAISEDVVTEETEMEIEVLDDIEETELLEGIGKTRKSDDSQKSGSFKSQNPLQCQSPPKDTRNLTEAVEQSTETKVTEGTNLSVDKQVIEKVQKTEEHRRSYDCSTCGLIFKNRFQLSLHLRSSGHILNGTICCPSCFKRPCRHEQYLLAYEKQKGSGMIECFECKLVFASLNGLIAHVTRDHLKKKCENCNLTIKCNLFETHKRKCQKPKIAVKCAKSPAVLELKEPAISDKDTFANKAIGNISKENKASFKATEIKEAERTMEVEELKDADKIKVLDEFEETRKNGKRKPSKKHVPTKPRPLQCVTCDLICAHELAYVVHNLEHELLVVGESSTEKEMPNERGKAEITEDEKTHECGSCGKTFKHSSWLRLHVKATNHVAKRKSICPQCTKRPCKHEEYLLAFENQNPNNIECEECKNLLESLSEFIAHVNRDHLESKPLKCDRCNEEFYLRTQLKAHLKVHEPKLTCEYCFCEIRRSFFKKHKTKCKVTKKQLKCSHCPALFSKNEAYQTHNTKKHRVREQS